MLYHIKNTILKLKMNTEQWKKFMIIKSALESDIIRLYTKWLPYFNADVQAVAVQHSQLYNDVKNYLGYEYNL